MMLRWIRYLRLTLPAIFLLNSCTCRPDAEFFTVFVHDWQGKWLDNTGAEPFLTVGPVARAAFGFRLSALLSSNGQDTVTNLNSGLGIYSVKPVQNIRFFTPTGFDSLPANADISDRFRLRLAGRDGYSLQYFPVDFSLGILNAAPASWENDYHVDFLMTSPPSQTGLFECAVKITFDSMATPPMDTFFTLPPIFLQ